MTILYPYKAGSNSAKDLAQALGIKRISHKNSKFKGSPDKTVLNWGASNVPEEVAKCTIINKPGAVSLAADKLKFFEQVKGSIGRLFLINNDGQRLDLPYTHQLFPKKVVGEHARGDASWVIEGIEEPKIGARTPKFTANWEVAEGWIDEGYVVVCRTILNGNSGEGIVLAETVDELVEAPLYVRYVPKKQEYRVHVFRDGVVDVQRKARRKDVADDQVNWKIRNHDNGFIFARGEDLGEVPEDVLTQSINAVKACGLDFGAVDVIFNEKEQSAYVLEVNTAPGLSGATLDVYVERFKEIV